MENSEVTPQMRLAGWNVQLIIGQEPVLLAGLYLHPGANQVTFRRLVRELSLCFEFTQSEETPTEFWKRVAFALVSSPEISPSFVTENTFDQLVPSLPRHTSSDPSIIQYHIISHGECTLADGAPLEAHIEAKCAEHLSPPERLQHPHYLPLNQTLSNPTYTARPPGKKSKTEGSQSLKRKTWRESEAEDIGIMAVPQSPAVEFKDAERIKEDFLSLILANSDRCAISGLGQSWCFTQAIGPALQPCQIVPQNHYHRYPGPLQGWERFFADDRGLGTPQVLAQSWSAPNGILLMSHLREAFELRLVSIHPETLRVRAFVPYDAITQYDGQKGFVPDSVDRGALKHHYEMCCIENMASLMPIIEQV